MQMTCAAALIRMRSLHCQPMSCRAWPRSAQCWSHAGCSLRRTHAACNSAMAQCALPSLPMRVRHPLHSTTSVLVTQACMCSAAPVLAAGAGSTASPCAGRAVPPRHRSSIRAHQHQSHRRAAHRHVPHPDTAHTAVCCNALSCLADARTAALPTTPSPPSRPCTAATCTAW